MNEFAWKNGRLEHYVDGQLRAVIEAENVAAYVEAAGLDAADIPKPSKKG